MKSFDRLSAEMHVMYVCTMYYILVENFFQAIHKTAWCVYTLSPFLSYYEHNVSIKRSVVFDCEFGCFCLCIGMLCGFRCKKNVFSTRYL